MPPGWESFLCCDLAKLLKGMYDALAKRYQDMLDDKLNLYNNPNAVPVGKGGDGTWDGHKQQYENLQKQMKKVLEKMLDNKCQDPISVSDEVWNAIDAPAPEKPSRYPYVSCPDPHECTGGTGYGAPPVPGSPGAVIIIGVGAGIIVGTIIEDGATGGAGVADDPATIGLGGELIMDGILAL